eukprot:1956542-Rhodomonas_salina.1
MPVQVANSWTLASSLFMSRTECVMRARSSAKQAAALAKPLAWAYPTQAVPMWQRQRLRKKLNRVGLSASP